MNEHASNLFLVKCKIPDEKDSLLAYIRKFINDLFSSVGEKVVIIEDDFDKTLAKLLD